MKITTSSTKETENGLLVFILSFVHLYKITHSTPAKLPKCKNKHTKSERNNNNLNNKMSINK